MKLLILGGTWFLGRHIVGTALAKGHELTLFNRGKNNPDLFPGVEKLRGDRNGSVEILQGHYWDAVIDTSGFEPHQVHSSASLLTNQVAHYIFISSIDVYKDFRKPQVNETYPLDDSLEQTYGTLKVKCEETLQSLIPERLLIIRPSLIVGPYDLTDRFTYWPRRLSQGGNVLAPGKPSRLIQFIDARDLAEWIVKMVEAKQTGIFNATGPAYPLTMGQFLDECKLKGDEETTFTWVTDILLQEQKIVPWEELPLWMPESDTKYSYLGLVSYLKAVEAGLQYRPLAATIQDTLNWDRDRPVELDRYRFAGLKPEKEKELLNKWNNS